MNEKRTIELTQVESSQLESYGYDAETGTLAVRFRGHGGKPGSLYHYRNVGASEWAAFNDASSKGSYFIRTIKPNPARYPYSRVEEATPEPTPEPAADVQGDDQTQAAPLADDDTPPA